MRRRHRALRIALLLAVWAAASVVGVTAYATDLLRRPELDTVDARFGIRGERPAPTDVAVVAIDDRTFDELDLRWPFPRSLHGRVVDRLRRAGARVIAYDVQFTEPTQESQDLALYDAVARARGRTVLGTTEVGPGGSTNVLGGDANLRDAGARAANANYILDPGGVIRRLPYEADGLKGFAVAAAEVARGRRIARFDDDGEWIDYAGPERSVRTLSFSQVAEGRFPAAAVRGRVVVVGASAPSLQDTHAAATTPSMSGPEIQAHAISTALRGFPLSPVAGWVNLLAIVLLAGVPALAGVRLGAVGSLAVSLVAAAAFAVGTQLAFGGGAILAFVYPIGALTLAAAGTLLVHYVTEVRERRRTRAAFARFVPPQVVDQVLEEAEDGLRLGGKEVEGTVMFSDVRGFTTFSESTPAPRVLEILNRYLSEMTEAILNHGGTLTTYIGDGIMAVFGAPLHQADHADRALAAAREMVDERLPRFNAWVREQGVGQEFQIGIGLNTGSFMAGNVGSEQRLDYTAIGDTVNTAARLEGMTKGSGFAVFVAGSTRAALQQDAPDLQYVDKLAVRGRQEKIPIWGVAVRGPSQPHAPEVASAEL
ncbi:MAG TPA: adenylate/guanylate cyclase domain-containing protein [Solirubrobacteraceae bacterium]|nr:adenylate/guanylate cyclase domain-containing protein [Solirubrobacteraceae bacterium]